VAAGKAAPTQEEIRRDADSGASVQSLKLVADDDYGTDVTKGGPPGASTSSD